jgi:transposase
VREALEPLIKEIESLTEKIHASDRKIEQIARTEYPETAMLQRVGPEPTPTADHQRR